jgi:hypothetical protein
MSIHMIFLLSIWPVSGSSSRGAYTDSVSHLDAVIAEFNRNNPEISNKAEIEPINSPVSRAIQAGNNVITDSMKQLVKACRRESHTIVRRKILVDLETNIFYTLKFLVPQRHHSIEIRSLIHRLEQLLKEIRKQW